MPGRPATLPALLVGCFCTFFASSPASAGESVLYAFNGGADGSHPVGGLIEVNGNFYGMTADGGASGYGTIFSLTPGGVKTTLYSFKGGSDGRTPTGGLDYVAGTFYGNTTYGGNGIGVNCQIGCGTVFSVTPTGDETVLTAFIGTGSSPEFPVNSGLVNIGDTLYGVSSSGGISQFTGTVFSVTLDGTLNVLYSFGKKYPHEDGSNPEATPIKLNGLLYGTTVAGAGGYNLGAIYSITPRGKETVLHIFKTPRMNGNLLDSRLAYLNGKLYGTTSEGGPYDGGTFFRCSTTGAVTSLYSFGAPGDGTDPLSLTRVDRQFYGATSGGGGAGHGTIFVITKEGKETLLYSFLGAPDASAPNSRLLDANGTFYGTSTNGGGSTHCSGGCGTVFAYTP